MSFNPSDARTLHSPESLIAVKSAAFGVLTAVALGVASYLALLFLSDATQTGAMFFSIPFAMGAAIGYLARLPLWGCLITGCASVLSVAALLMLLDALGPFCGLTLCVFFLPPLAAGVLLGRLCLKVVARSRWARRRYLPLLAFVGLPFLHRAIDLAVIDPPLPTTVATEETIDAPPGDVWREIVFFEEVETDPPLLLRLGLPRPSHVEGRHEAAGDIATCVYEDGRLVKRITAVETARRLAFEVVEQRLHFEHDVTLLGGGFDLEALPAGGTRLRLTTTYRSHLSPEWLWRPLERLAIETLHRHVIRRVRDRAALGERPE
jgi:hypothetical protein